ncbi:ABC transporter permease [Pseudomonas nitroreducens]|uniref:ABC transporter permease n=1 Tax=Pseudomonas nitroreducens TaxID=46680 RepID=A0A6G6J2X9_PSENT|nr:MULTISPECIES: ABC transporter permease [Pseudomonas]MBG6290522.1 ABC transporter permease [Pseudomonas nitroreducens]MCJ1880167.1 ABC transporter permease [Pseudomonas nitroreducens]MCJ1897487.1 ABC transporter permease [Pseudomonas nitroreducens]NMZ58427.1 ABC transporter permease [Pseudomonas nitroreducens]NNN28549.1 ABC transporter permease [Pseudomonas nitroreducens]
MQNFWTVFRQSLGNMLGKPLWLLMVLSVTLTTLPYAHRTMDDLPVAVIDMDHSSVSRELIRQLDAAPKIAVRAYDQLPEAQRDLAWRELFGIVVIPVDFEKRVLRGEAVTVPIFGDATNRMANGQIQQDISATYTELSLRYNRERLMRGGFSEQQSNVLLQPTIGQLTDLFNPGTSFAAIVLPGLVTLILQHSLLLSCTRVNLNLRGGTPRSLRQPASTRFGRYAAQLSIWTVLAMLFYVIWPWMMGYRQTASFFMLMGLVLPFLLAVIAMSEFIAEVLPSEEAVYLTMTFITLPLFYMAGFTWPPQAMPQWVQLLADAIPSTWAIRAVVEMNQMNLPLSAVADRILILFAMAAAYGLLGTLVYQYRNWRWDQLKGW